MNDPIDPITFEVLTHKLWQITDEMGVTLKLVSASPIVSTGDFCTAICTKDGDLAAMGTYITANAWAIRTAIKNIVKSKIDEIEDGDMFVMNDPWLGSLHQSDLIIVAPIYYKKKLFCWSGSMAHQLDIGAIRPGGFAAATEVYQEGLRLPPIKLVEGGKLRQDLFNMILNMVRVPQVGLDIKGQIATNNVCKERVTKLCERFGPEIVERVARRGIEVSNEKLAHKLRELPDGTFRHTDFIDYDGLERKLLSVVLTMTKKGDNLLFDFGGTSDQTSGYMNCTLSGTWGGVIGATLPWLCYDIQWNEGALRPLQVNAREGSLINANIPAAVSFTTTGPLHAVRNVATMCLSKMFGCSEKYREDSTAVWQGAQPKVLFGGTNQFGERYVCNIMDNLTGGGGARATRDGVDSGGSASGSDPSVPNIETYESDYPMLFLFRRQSTDTGGSGKFRGGVGCEECFIPYETDSLLLTFIARGVDVASSVGVFGGYPSCVNEGVLIKNWNLLDPLQNNLIPNSMSEFAGKKEKLPACVDRLRLSKRDAFFFKWNGGGGYGDPIDRAPEDVIVDIREGIVSPKEARETYGVVLNRGNSSINSAQTEKERRLIRNQRSHTKRPHSKMTREIIPLGPYLGIDLQKQVRCVHCGYRYCRYDKNPKEYAQVHKRQISRGKFSEGEEIVRRDYFCPGCSTMISVDTELKGLKPVFDIQLDIQAVESAIRARKSKLQELLATRS